MTALMLAAWNCHTEVTKLLLDRGADVNSKSRVSDMIWNIVVIVCISDCVIVIMILIGSVIVISTIYTSTSIDLSIINCISRVSTIAHNMFKNI